MHADTVVTAIVNTFPLSAVSQMYFKCNKVLKVDHSMKMAYHYKGHWEMGRYITQMHDYVTQQQRMCVKHSYENN